MAESKVNKLEDIFPLMVASKEAMQKISKALDMIVQHNNPAASPNLKEAKEELNTQAKNLSDFLIRELFDSSSCLLTPLKKSKKE
jgi:cellobiose-specific phosphotransferase system component IIA